MRLILALSINLLFLALFFLFSQHLYVGILAAASLLGWFFYFLWRRQNLVRQRLESKVKGQKIIMPIEHMMFRAIESSGYSQSSGMGYMVLTENFLYFELVLLDLVVDVPTSNLCGAEFTYRLKGVSPGRRMLRILYKTETGEDDSIAVNVKDMDRWKKSISDICEKAA